MALTLTATLKNISGAAIPNARMRVTLGGYGALIPRVAGTNIIASTAPLEQLANGSGVVAAFPIIGNDAITPAGTFYTVQILDDQGNPVQANDYQFTGNNPLDLSNLAPYNPPAPAYMPPSGISPVLNATTINNPTAGQVLATVVPQRSNPNAFYEVLTSGLITSTVGTGGVVLQVTLPATILQQEVTVTAGHTRSFIIGHRFGITVNSYWSSYALYNDIPSGPGVGDIESIGPYDFTQITSLQVIASRTFTGSLRMDYLVTRVNW